jgi:hypothetical protein
MDDQVRASDHVRALELQIEQLLAELETFKRARLWDPRLNVDDVLIHRERDKRWVVTRILPQISATDPEAGVTMWNHTFPVKSYRLFRNGQEVE